MLGTTVTRKVKTPEGIDLIDPEEFRIRQTQLNIQSGCLESEKNRQTGLTTKMVLEILSHAIDHPGNIGVRCHSWVAGRKLSELLTHYIFEYFGKFPSVVNDVGHLRIEVPGKSVEVYLYVSPKPGSKISKEFVDHTVYDVK